MVLVAHDQPPADWPSGDQAIEEALVVARDKQHLAEAARPTLDVLEVPIRPVW